MDIDLLAKFRPVAAPQIIEDAYSADQFERMVAVINREGPWTLILAQHFKTPEEVIATTSGSVPEGFKPTWDMFLSPVFRGYFAKGSTSLYPELEDCFFNKRFLDLARAYWGAKYAQPESMLFNLQGPCPMGGMPHIDGTRFRGVDMDNTPPWLLNTMCKSTLFKPWQAKKAQVIAWYYKGSVGGGFHYWPEGPGNPYQTIEAPMWGRAVVVENEMMYHTAQANGPEAMRRPAGLDITSTIETDPDHAGGWRIMTEGQVIQQIPAIESRYLFHWNAQVFMDLDELKVTLDHKDDLTHERVFDVFIADLRQRGITFEVPSDPMYDPAFIGLLTRTYDHGFPTHMPTEPLTPLAA